MASADAEAAQQRVTKEMTNMVDELDRTQLRRIQMMMHNCAAKCCESDTASMDQTQRCITNCSRGVEQAQNYVQQEIGSLQNRLQRCVLDCQDRVKDKLGANPGDQDVEDAKAQFEVCAIKCVDNHITLIPSLLRRMKSHLSSIN